MASADSLQRESSADSGPVTTLGQSRPAQYDVKVLRNLRVPSSSHGMTLGADLYLPEGDQLFPTLVTLHAARKDAVGGIGTRRYLRYFAQRGYAAVYVDAFGVGTSEGAPRPMLDPAEADDGVAVVEWAARQPWSTGRIGMWGYSHGGMTTLATAARRPSHLRAIFPIMGLTDPERDLVHPEGLRGGIGMFGQLGVFDVLCALLPHLRDADREEYGKLWRDRLDRFSPWMVDAWDHGPGDSAWRLRAVDPSLINVPSLCVIGWHDAFCAAMFRAYEQISAPKKLIVGPWLHIFPDSSPVEPVTSMSLACEWWDQWLGAEAPPSGSETGRSTLYVRGDRARWVQADSWPPEQVGELSLRSASGGRLVDEQGTPPEDGSFLCGEPAGHAAPISADPTVGALNGLARVPVNSLGYPPDQHDDDSRSVSFTSDALAAPLLLAGQPAVTLLLHHASTASRCAVKITDVDPGGRSTIISTGLLNVAEHNVAGQGRPTAYPVEMTPACYCLPAGHRVRLAIAAADFPGLWPETHPADLRIVADSPSAARPATAEDTPATRVRLPLTAPRHLTDVRFLAPPHDVGRRRRRELPPPRWEVTRDLYRQHLLTVVDITEGGTYLPDKDNFLKLTYLIKAEIDKTKPADTQISTSASISAELENGEHAVAKAHAEIKSLAARLRAEVSIENSVIFQKEWEM